MGSLFINNRSTAVRVLKASNLPDLRLFPGENMVDAETIDLYFDSDVALAMKEEFLTFRNEVDAESKTAAQAAMEKNLEMNRDRIAKVQKKAKK